MDRNQGAYLCSNKKCDFAIGLAKFEAVVTDLYKPKKLYESSYDQNLEALNNLQL